jgi:5-methyltetrahydrofolate--homocysteine methyltransferase
MSKHNDLLERFAQGGLLFDGGLGSMLIAEGLTAGAPPDEWNLSHPDILLRIHKAYLEAGSDFVSTNTFGASPSRLQTHGLEDTPETVIAAGIGLAREAADSFDKRVALSIGPTGKMFPPVGTATEEEIREEFVAQLSGIDDRVDLVLFETFLDLKEALIALDIAKSTLPQPVGVSLTYTRNPRGFFTIMGNAAVDAVKQIEAAGADIVSANCSIASDDMLGLADIMRDATRLPILCQPNAGNPIVRDRKACYDQTPEEFADDAMLLYDKGVNAVGGCCGTTPDFIREVAGRLR